MDSWPRLLEIRRCREVHYRKMAIQKPVKHLRWNAFSIKLNCFRLLTIFEKCSILDFWLGSVYASDRWCGLNSKCILELFGKNRLLLDTIRATG